MHIQGWHIDAFGALSDVERSGVAEGLTVLHGPNEAGKSTLRHFVLGVLFGFPAGNTRYPRYNPPSGAMRSGRLYLDSDGEEFVLSRVEKRGARAGEMTLLGPDGKARGDAEMTALLGGLTRGVYDKIFAIGLDELNDLAALTAGDLQDHLLSAGVTGAGRVATRARNELRERAGTIHRSRAQSTEVVEIRDRLREVEDRLAEARRAARDLDGRRETLESRRLEAEELAASETAATRAVQRAERLAELWPLYLEAAAASAEVESMAGAGAPLPPGTAEGLTRALAARDAAEAEVVDRTEKLDRSLARLEVLEAGHLPGLAALAPDLAALQHRLSGWASQEEELRVRTDELDELERRFAAELDAVGIADAAELTRIGKVVAARDQLRHTRETFDEKSAARRLALDEVERQSREVMDAEAEVQTASTAMEVVPDDLSAPALRVQSNRAAQEAILLERLTADVTDLEKLRRDLVALEGSEETGTPAVARTRTSVEPRVLLLGLTVVLAMAAVVSGIVVSVVAGVLLGIAACVTGVSSFLVNDSVRRNPGDDARRKLSAEIDFLERKCTDTAQMLGFSGIPAMDTVVAARVERDRQSAALTDLVAADNRLSTARAAMRSKKEHLAELTRASDRTLATWQEWLREHRLPDALRPEGVDEWLTHLDQARALADQIRVARKRLEALRSSLDSAPKSVIELTDRVEEATRGEAPDGSQRPGTVPLSVTPARADSTVGELQAVIASIAESVAGAVTTEHEVARVRDAAEVFQGELDRAVAVRDTAVADLETIYGSAGVADEAEMHRRLADDERRRVLAATVEGFERRLATESGTHAEEDRATLAERTPDIWADERAAAAERARSLAERRDDVLREVGALESEVRLIEESADLPVLGLEREELIERLARAIRSWTVLHQAAGLIDRTLERYLDERQPAVLQRAEVHLATITDGRYTTIRLDPELDGTPRLSVIDTRGRPHAPQGLSRGTVEQVYLCLRLALAEQHHQSLPLLLDDILVNFDPERAETTTRVLAQVAEERQVIVFTCHPWVVDIMSDVAPGLGLVDLGNRIA